MDRSRLGAAAALVVIAAALGAFFAPLFTREVSALTGDNATHSLPLHLDLARSLRDATWRHWDPRIAFGFPLAAEGQAGWLHPWRVLVLASFPGLTGHDLVYVSSFFATGASGLLLIRTFGLGLGAALLGGLAIAFSPVVLDSLYNAAYAHSTAWAAVCLLAFERWWASPRARRLALFAASIALLICAGYPPTAYALFLFLGVVVTTRIALDRRGAVARAGGLAAALALGLGLAAPQLLPLLELASASVRQEAVAVLNAFPWRSFVGGLVFDPDPALYHDGRYAFFTAPLATTLALVAVPFLPALRDRRMQSYVAGSIVCVCVASGPGNPLHDLLRAVAPGFDRLRLLSPFLFVAVVPAGVLLAALLTESARGGRTHVQRGAITVTAVAFTLFVVLSIPAATALPWFRHLGLALAAIAVLALVALPRVGRPGALWAVWTAVLLVEIAVLRTGHRAWLPDAVLEEGRPLAEALDGRAKHEPTARAIHFPSRVYRATSEGMVRQHWKSPGYRALVRNGLRVQTPLANLPADLPFAEMSGALALHGYEALLARMQDELRGRDATPPGERAIDRWQVRWLVRYGELAKLPRAAGFTPVWSDPRGDLELLENANALPRHQWRETRTTAEQSAPAAWRRAIERLPWVSAEREAPFEWEAAAPGRLFAAIPLHPGWSARLDDRVVRPERAADGFGMEIPAGAGAHRVELRFVPHAFHAGVLVFVASAAVWLALLRGRRDR